MYTHGHHESVLRSHRWRTAQNSAAYLLPHLRPGLSSLDVGCGPGTITAGLAVLVAPGVVTALEVSEDVLGLARSTVDAANVRFVVGDVHALEFPDDTFDVVHAHQVLDLYERVARHNGGEPDAGRHLLAWAHAAGFGDVTATSSTWCYANPEDRVEWGGMWADRIRQSAIATRALETGMATADDLERISRGWRDWVADDDGWMSVLHGEILCRA